MPNHLYTACTRSGRSHKKKIKHATRIRVLWFHHSGAAICWKSKVQSITSLSSTESELIAVDSAVRELRFLLKLLRHDFKIDVPAPVLIAQDNQSTLAIIKSRHFNARTRHLALRYHHVGDHQKDGTLKTEYLSTDKIPADVLTKALDKDSHLRHTRVLMGHDTIEWEALEQHNSKRQRRTNQE